MWRMAYCWCLQASQWKALALSFVETSLYACAACSASKKRTYTGTQHTLASLNGRSVCCGKTKYNSATELMCVFTDGFDSFTYSCNMQSFPNDLPSSLYCDKTPSMLYTTNSEHWTNNGTEEIIYWECKPYFTTLTAVKLCFRHRYIICMRT